VSNFFPFYANNSLMVVADDAQREATHFKNRVLDLVDTYLKKQPASPFVLRLITPLVDIVAGSSQDERQLSDKARGIIRSRFGKVKDVPTDVDIEQVTLIATNLHSQARKSHSSELLSILSLCGIYLSRILVQVKAEKPLLESYRESLVDFTTRKNSSLNTFSKTSSNGSQSRHGVCVKTSLINVESPSMGTAKAKSYNYSNFLSVCFLQ